MIIDVSKIRSGKTKRAVEWVKEGRPLDPLAPNLRVLLVYCSEERRLIERQYELARGEVQTLDRFISDTKNQMFRFVKREAYIDNADLILQNMLGWLKVSGVSLSTPMTAREEYRQKYTQEFKTEEESQCK